MGLARFRFRRVTHAHLASAPCGMGPEDGTCGIRRRTTMAPGLMATVSQVLAGVLGSKSSVSHRTLGTPWAASRTRPLAESRARSVGSPGSGRASGGPSAGIACPSRWWRCSNSNRSTGSRGSAVRRSEALRLDLVGEGQHSRGSGRHLRDGVARDHRRRRPRRCGRLARGGGPGIHRGGRATRPPRGDSRECWSACRRRREALADGVVPVALPEAVGGAVLAAPCGLGAVDELAGDAASVALLIFGLSPPVPLKSS